MVDIRLDIRNLFPQCIVKVNSDLVPQPFIGNRYQVTDAKYKTSQIIDTLGSLSASAQCLNKPITTSQKLREFNDQTIYLMADTSVKPRGVAIGLLKIGKKDLFVYNQSGIRHQVKSPCILDFFIHDTYQRSGYGKVLFDAMLANEKLKPHEYTIDRPSDKMINFMKKHYGLYKMIPQPNHYMLYEGYFDNKKFEEFNHHSHKPYQIEFIAKTIPSHYDYNRSQKLVVTRYESRPNPLMAGILPKRCGLLN